MGINLTSENIFYLWMELFTNSWYNWNIGTCCL